MILKSAPLSALRRGVVFALLGGLIVLQCSAWAQRSRRRSDAPPQTTLPDPIERLTPRDEAADDRLEAMAWYTQGRMLLRRGENAEALRAYQRAWRYDPELVSVMTEIVPLTVNLRRSGEATRYAVLAAEQGRGDERLLDRMAAVLASNDEWKRAIGLYERLLKTPTKPPRELKLLPKYVELARLYVLTDRTQDAAQVLRMVKRVMNKPGVHGFRPNDVRGVFDDQDVVLILMAETFLANQQWQAADEAFAARLFRQEDVPELAFHRARIANAQNNDENARELLDIYLKSSNQAAGISAFRMLKELAPDDYLKQLQQLVTVRADDRAFQLELGLEYLQAKQLKEALAVLRPLHADQPSVDTSSAIAAALRQAKQYPELAEHLAEIAIKTGNLRALDEELEPLAQDAATFQELAKLAKPDNENASPGLALALALLALEQEQFEQADDWFSQAESAITDTRQLRSIQIGWSMVLLRHEQGARAAEVLTKAIAESPRSSRAGVYSLQSDAYLQAEEFALAVRSAQRAAALDSESPYLAMRVGWALVQSDRLGSARDALERSIEAFEQDYREDNREDIKQLRMVLSGVYMDLDDFDQAVEQIERVLDEFPLDSGASNDLGYLWADRGLHLQRALRMTRRAAETEPENAAYLDSLGWALYQNGQFEAAVEPLEQAVKREQDDGVLHDHLGDAYFKLNRRDDAMRMWRRAQQLLEDDATRRAKVDEKLKQLPSESD